MPVTAAAVLGGIRSLSKALADSTPERTSEAILIPLDARSDRITNESFRFQYFPETIQSTKQSNLQQKEIVGGSLPLYQWIAGGEHVVSFTAIFTCDLDLLVDRSLAAMARADGLRNRNADPRAAVAWLRQFKLPTYAEERTVPPRKLVLFLPGTGIGLLGGVPPGTEQLRPDSLYTILTQCDVTYQALFPSGLPRYLEVQVAFAQTAQYGGTVQFPGAGAVYGTLLAGSAGSPFAPYGLLARQTPFLR